MPSKLYLIANFLSENLSAQLIPEAVVEIVKDLRWFIVEDKASAERFLKTIRNDFPLTECTFFEFNEHSSPQDAREIFKSLQGKNAGIISEAGMPCVADPGQEIVLLAHQNNWEVIALPGSSSIFLALAASGLNGQNFAFNGYLPKEREERIKKLKMLEERSWREHQTQIFMEAPYRNQHLLEDILKVCSPKTFLCLAVDLTGPSQFIKTVTIEEWRKLNPSIQKKPALFLIQKLK